MRSPQTILRGIVPFTLVTTAIVALWAVAVSAQPGARPPDLRAMPPAGARIEPLNRARLERLPEALTASADREYAVYSLSPRGFVTSTKVGTWHGRILTPRPQQTGELRIGAPEAKSYAQYESKAGDLSRVIRGWADRPIGVVTLHADGHGSATIDVDRDGVAELLEILHPKLGSTVLADTRVGVRLLDLWLNGRNPFCVPDAGLVDGKADHAASAGDGVFSTTSPIASIHSCTQSKEPSPGISSDRDARPPSTGRDFEDVLCSSLDAKPPTAPVGSVYDGSSDSIIGKVVGGLATRAFLRWLSRPLNLEGALTDAEVGAIASTRLAQFNAVGAFIAITLTPATAAASPCELGAAGACDPGAEGDRTGRADDRNSGGDHATGTGGTGGGPRPPSTTRRPVGPSADSEARAWCSSRAKSRTYWDRLVKDHDRVRAALEQECQNPAASGAAASSSRVGSVATNCSKAKQAADRVSEAIDPESMAAAMSGGCAINERSAPGAKCRATTSVMRVNGSRILVVGAGDLIGIQSCPPQSCRPGEGEP